MRNIWPRILENQWAEQQDSGTDLEDKLWNFFRRRRRHSRNEELADIISVLLFGRMRRRRHSRNQEVTDRFDTEFRGTGGTRRPILVDTTRTPRLFAANDYDKRSFQEINLMNRFLAEA